MLVVGGVETHRRCKSAASIRLEQNPPEILKINPDHFARQITLIELEKLQAIKSEEFRTFKWTGQDKEKFAPNIVASTRWFNQLNLWVQKEILNQENLSCRSDVLSHFITIAQYLISYNNFSSAMAIMSSLQTEAIFRLRRTWMHLSEEAKNNYRKLEAIFSQTDNSCKLKCMTEKAELPVIPYLGIYLTELVYINTAHPRDGGKPNPVWLRKISSVIEKIAFYQQSSYREFTRA
ncbi:RasGEF [Cichlidogyrus casuarinus]|uniref:RasGEF n=1 Tax=Cichlidogyrus casuarinus TaxID=1844966 RepID=A0ABD2Q265_9PLAT